MHYWFEGIQSCSKVPFNLMFMITPYLMCRRLFCVFVSFSRVKQCLFENLNYQIHALCMLYHGMISLFKNNANSDFCRVARISLFCAFSLLLFCLVIFSLPLFSINNLCSFIFHKALSALPRTLYIMHCNLVKTH